MLALVALLTLVTVFYLIFVSYYPTFGGDISKERQQQYINSPQFKEGTFVNEKAGIPKDPSFSEIVTIARKFFFTEVENGSPKDNIAVQKVTPPMLAQHQDDPKLIWFGHSAFLLQIAGKNILIDPMLSEVPAPHPLLGSKRFTKDLPIAIEQFPKIDALLISHDHYDHLDYSSIKKLKDKVETYFVPLGVGVHLEAWGIAPNQIKEMDWWQETTFKDLKLACTPAQHFSGRKFTNGQSTLWSSWVIASNKTSIYFSGDGGYGPHFKQIGEQYGPFDLALMECGQYNKMWPDIHMFPEETAQAGLDVKAKAMMPIHWGAFKLALHSWTDPIERVTIKAQELQLPLVTPKIGAPVFINKLPKQHSPWWQ